MSNPERFDELHSRYLDDALSTAEEAELCESLSQPECAERFLETTKLNAEIAGLLAAPVPDAVMAELVLSDIKRGEADRVIPMPRVVAARWPGALKWAAVFVALGAVAAVYFSGDWRSTPKTDVAVSKGKSHSHAAPPPLEKPPELVAVQGEVYLIDASGQTHRPDKQPFNKAPKLKTVGKESGARIVLGDGTRVDVGGDSLLATESAADKPRFFLESGSLESQVAKQPLDRPLIFATAHAEAIVQGTALSIVVLKHHTRVVVTEGEVLVKQREDGTEVMVRAGYHVLVTPHTKMAPSPNDPASKHR